MAILYGSKPNRKVRHKRLELYKERYFGADGDAVLRGIL